MWRRACLDTRSYFGWNRKSILLPILWSGGAIIFYFWQGLEAVMGEIFVAIAFGLIPVGAFAILLFVWNLIRAPVYMRFEGKMKPRLEILCILETNVGRTGAGWSLEIQNNGTQTAKECHGNLEDIEFEMPHGTLSLAGWPRGRDLQWSGEVENTSHYDIAGGQHATLSLVSRDSAASDNNITLAYRGTEQFRLDHKLSLNDPILLLINITSEGRIPLYAICLLNMKAIASNIYRGYSGQPPVTLLYKGEQRRSLNEFQKSLNSSPTLDT